MEFGQASMTTKSHRILPLDVRTELVPIQDFDEVVEQRPKNSSCAGWDQAFRGTATQSSEVLRVLRASVRGDGLVLRNLPSQEFGIPSPSSSNCLEAHSSPTLHASALSAVQPLSADLFGT